jgi:hypothetical protein
MNGASRRRMIACPNERIVPPSILPSAMLILDIGATITDCRKPTCRSSIIEIDEKIEENNMIRRIVPG